MLRGSRGGAAGRRRRLFNGSTARNDCLARRARAARQVPFDVGAVRPAYNGRQLVGKHERTGGAS